MGCCKEENPEGSDPGDSIAALLVWLCCGSLNSHRCCTRITSSEPTESEGAHADNPEYDLYNELKLEELSYRGLFTGCLVASRVSQSSAMAGKGILF